MSHMIRRAGYRRPLLAAALWVNLGWTSACSLDGLLKSNELPPDVTDPAITETPAGALAAYNGTLAGFQGVFGPGYIVESGLLTDELTLSYLGGGGGQDDLRTLAEGPGSPSGSFQGLSNTRQRARQAVGLLADYLPDQAALRARLYAIAGYTEVMLAELYCSGIPLSTVDYRGDYTLQPGSKTADVFAHAAALFDTALTLAGDSVAVGHLSRIGQARALLGRGDYAAAAAAVASVPDDFRYSLRFTADSAAGPGYAGAGGDLAGSWLSMTVSDHEGTNGLNYRSSGDPRTQVTLLSNGHYHPNKYTMDGADTIVLASGVEARLIEAEAALQAGDPATWLAKVNALRTDGTYDATSPPDTLWHAGSGGYEGLAPLSDPGTMDGRVNLLFRERALWLFLTGHRQGDMRRLVRQYHRLQSQVYPIGTSISGYTYGSYVDVPIPWSERTLNPLFTGCFARD